MCTPTRQRCDQKLFQFIPFSSGIHELPVYHNRQVQTVAVCLLMILIERCVHNPFIGFVSFISCNIFCYPVDYSLPSQEHIVRWRFLSQHTFSWFPIYLYMKPSHSSMNSGCYLSLPYHRQHNNIYLHYRK